MIKLIALLLLTITPNTNITGIWKMNGYGQILEITNSEIKYYDLTQKSCTPIKTIPSTTKTELGTIIKVTKDSLFYKNGITEYHLSRLPQLPDLCAKQDTALNKTPLYNFEVFWTTFKENYAFFKERKINWDKIHDTYTAQINEKTTNLQLYTIFNSIIAQLNDDHTTFPEPDELTEAIAKNNAAAAISPFKLPETNRKELRDGTIAQYAPQFKSAGRDMYGKGLVNWGITKDNIGYLQVNWMLFYNSYDIPETLTGEAYTAQYFEKTAANPNMLTQELTAIKKIMKEVTSDFKNTKGIILDIRFNGGGYDDVALEILSHFTQQQITVFTKKAKLPTGGFTQPQAIRLIPAPDSERLNQPLIILTSHSSASAAEILAISSMALKNVLRIGSNTEGIFSDVLEKKLPNGWSFSLSNEVYQNFEGKNFENIGIPPTVAVEYPKGDELFFYYMIQGLKQKDKAIELAIELLK